MSGDTAHGLVVAKVFTDEPMAWLAKEILEGNGLRAILSEDSGSGMEPQLNFSRGIRLMVDREDLEKATELLADQ